MQIQAQSPYRSSLDKNSSNSENFNPLFQEVDILNKDSRSLWFNLSRREVSLYFLGKKGKKKKQSEQKQKPKKKQNNKDKGEKKKRKCPQEEDPQQ